jgi:enamine deaminase RidA (YjgF/YER057c/UK114 family)
MPTPTEALNFNPEGQTTFSPTYSHISRVPITPTAILISIAGQLGFDATTGLIPPTLSKQCQLAFANADRCLQAAGACKGDIVQVRQYVVDLLRDGQGQDPERAKLYVEWMGELRPPSTVLGVQALVHKDLLYEIEIVCLVQER